jgi:hypothetical protein
MQIVVPPLGVSEDKVGFTTVAPTVQVQTVVKAVVVQP